MHAVASGLLGEATATNLMETFATTEVVHDNDRFSLTAEDRVIFGRDPENAQIKTNKPATKFIKCPDIYRNELSRRSVAIYFNHDKGRYEIMNLGVNEVVVWTTDQKPMNPKTSVNEHIVVKEGGKLNDRQYATLGDMWSVDITTANKQVVRLTRAGQGTGTDTEFRVDINPKSRYKL